MGQINLTFISKNIDPKDHILSVLIEADSFVYGVFDKQLNLVAAGDHTIDMHKQDPFADVKKDENVNVDYYKSLVVYSTEEFAHLGELDFGGGDFEAYFNDMAIGSEFLNDRLTDSGIHVVFPVDRRLRANINEIVMPSSEMHISTAMRQYIYPSHAKKNVILVGADRLHYMSYNKGGLVLYNAYTYRTKEDFLYYLQLATDFASVDREVDVLEIGGWLGVDSDIYKYISPYYRHLEWVGLSAMNLESKDEDHLKHHYFALYANALCAS